MNIDEKALDTLIKGLVQTVKKSINSAKFLKGVTGRVIEKLDNDNYVVNINGKAYIAKCKDTLQINQIVKIIKWNNSLDELYILY